MFDANHDMCLLDFVNDVNVRSKSKSDKQSQQHNIWKPIGKVFIEAGYKWKPIGRLFTIVGNSCPITRITPTKVVQLMETTSNLVETPKPEIKVYSRRPKQRKIIGSSKKSKIVESKIANNSEPNHSWGSNAMDVPSSSSLVNDRFRIDQIAKIMGYDDYQLGNVNISRVYFVEGLGHNLFSVGQFCDIDLEVAFWKKTFFIQNLDGVDLLSGSKLSKDEDLDAIIKCIKNIQVRLNATIHNVRTYNGTKFVNQTLRAFYENFGITRQTSVARTPQQNGIVESQNRTLVEAARTMLIFSKALLFLWAEVINTACYTQNRSLFRLRYNKTPYELMHDKKPDLSFLHVFGSLYYPTNDSEDLGKLKSKADIRIFVGPGLQPMTPTTSSLGLVPNPVPQQPFNPPMRNDWDRLFQPMFDEYFNPPSSAVSLVLVDVALRAVEIAATPSLTTIDQDAPSSKPIPNVLFDDPCHEPLHDVSTSQELSSNVQSSHSLLELIGKWTKDHLLANVISNPSRPVSTRKQLETDAMWCYFDAFLTSVEPKNFKQTMLESSWIAAMQEEIHEFERIKVWELVPCPDKVMLVKLKWIFKVKTDEFGGVLKKKARLVTQGFRTMTTTAAQQVALDNALVPLEKRVKIDKCNMRIDLAKTHKEHTYQVVLDALALTVTPRLGGNTRRNIMDIITTQLCQQ
ncbi:retrovirus-related pol polyprotein from transposon TNT 1-94 [Tanacetum coccineum]